MSRAPLRLASLAVALTACGGTTISGPPTPRFIEGGGLGDGPISGGLNVYVADDETRKPVSGATVRVGGSSDPAACMATTDSTGLAVFESKTCSLLDGKQSITSSAAGYAPSTWIGVNAANVTMNIRAMTAPSFDSAVVTGSIAGWDGLAAPAAHHNILAFIGSSAGVHVSDAENNLPQDNRTVEVKLGDVTVPFPIAQNACVKTALVSDCNWRLKTRTGPQALYAVVLDQDTKGTEGEGQDGDDTFTAIGWAVRRGQSFSKDQGADGVTLTLIPDADMQTFTAAFPPPSSGMDYVAAFPVLELGAEGRIAIIIPALDLTQKTTRVPKLTGPFADAHYDFLAKAQDAKDKDQPGTLSWSRDVDASKTVTALDWLAVPTALKVMDGTYSFRPTPGATVSGAELQTKTGKRAWSITIFDDTTSFTLPGVSPDPLPAGDALFSASALVIPGFKANSARFDDLSDTVTHIATDQITFTH